jgi:hypothetical protein
MPVSYEGYFARSIECAIALVAAAPTVISLLTPTTPLDRIIEIDGGVEDETTPLCVAASGNPFNRTTAAFYAHVGADQPEWQKTWNAPQSITVEGTIPVGLYFRPAGISLRHELLRYCLSKTGLIAAEIEAQQGQANKWRRIIAQFGGCQFLDRAGHNRNALRTQINIQFGDLP